MNNNKAAENTDHITVRILNHAAVDAANPPEKILVAPWGDVQSSNGNFVVDEEGIRHALDAFHAHKTELPIDYEHQTLGGEFAAPSGQAPAAGWIKALRGECNIGLLAEIEWTEHARNMLKEKEYKYLSPVVVVRKEDRKLVALHSAALTNKPAIVGMKPIVNKQEDDPHPENQLKALRATLNMNENADSNHVLRAAADRLQALSQENEQRHIDDQIKAAMEKGILLPCQEDWAKAMIRKDRQLFDMWRETAPVIVATGKIPDSPNNQREQSINNHSANKARQEFRQNNWLADLTSEEAFVRYAQA